jgi:glycosyltransferase involved in cell wall biosynthesis
MIISFLYHSAECCTFIPKDMAQGLLGILSDDGRHQKLRQASRTKAEPEYNIARVARKYLALYKEILRRQKHY